jgi:hypothetical protein
MSTYRVNRARPDTANRGFVCEFKGSRGFKDGWYYNRSK